MPHASYLFSTVITTSPSAPWMLMPIGEASAASGVSRSPSFGRVNSDVITEYVSPPDDVRLDARTMSWQTCAPPDPNKRHQRARGSAEGYQMRPAVLTVPTEPTPKCYGSKRKTFSLNGSEQRAAWP